MIELEHLYENPQGPLSRNMELLRRLVIDPGDLTLSLRIGKTTVTWTGATSASTVVTVTHGLQAVPKIVIPAPTTSGTWINTLTDTLTDTTFKLYARTTDDVIPAAGFTCDIYWIVIG
jgi:hypothetical protein